MRTAAGIKLAIATGLLALLAVPLFVAWGIVIIFFLALFLIAALMFIVGHAMGLPIKVTKNGKLVGHIINFKFVPLK